MALGLLGCALGSLQRPKLFGTFKASEVSQTPVKVASVSIECSLNACALRRKVCIAGMPQVTFLCSKEGGRKLVLFFVFWSYTRARAYASCLTKLVF